MRKTFLEPELEVVRFGTEDIITTSFVNDGGTEGNIGGMMVSKPRAASA